jgi:peptidoglycan/LPS O-acetylase OafA/YrhL
MTQVLEAPAKPTARPATQPKATRLDGIDGLRALAALIVLLFHMYGQAGGPELRIHRVNLFRPLFDGWAAVNLFLVLSGFCLFWPFADRPGKPRRPLELKEYVRRRSVRILPTYYASLAFTAALGFIFPRITGDPRFLPDTLHSLVSHLLLLNVWFPKDLNSWNSVTWSLSLEWTWYAAFPLAVLLFRRIGADRGFLVLAGLCIGYRVAIRLLLGTSDHYNALHGHEVNAGFAVRTFVVGRLFEFGVGMYVAAWVARGRQLPGWLVDGGIFVVLGLLVAGHLATPVDPFLPVRDVLYGSAGAALLLLICAARQNPVRWLLSHRSSVWLGQFSYTLYLFHLAMLAVAASWFRHLGFKMESLPMFWLMLSTGPVVILASWAIYLVVERPFAMSKPQRQPVAPPDALVAPAV